MKGLAMTNIKKFASRIQKFVQFMVMTAMILVGLTFLNFIIAIGLMLVS